MATVSITNKGKTVRITVRDLGAIDSLLAMLELLEPHVATAKPALETLREFIQVIEIDRTIRL